MASVLKSNDGKWYVNIGGGKFMGPYRSRLKAMSVARNFEKATGRGPVARREARTRRKPASRRRGGFFGFGGY